MRQDDRMCEFAWAARSPSTLVPVPAVAPMPALLDADAADAPLLPTVPTAAVGDDEPLLPLGPDVQWLGVYARHGFPAAVAEGFLRRETARRLSSAAAALPHGFGLAVFDAWRDPALQTFLYERAYAEPGLPPGFVSPPSPDPATPPPHATGGTVDLTLTWQGTALALGTDFDQFTERAFSPALEGEESAEGRRLRDLRRLLRSAMVDQGFVALAREWWHFEYGTRLWAAVTGSAPRYHAAARP